MRKHGGDAAAVLLLLFLPLLWFAPVALGGRTLLPADNLFAFQPWASYAAEQGVGIPHNELLSDLILENYVWKLLIREALQARELPLWNPYLFAGVPFLAAGQHSALYPLSLLFYVLPLSRAYGLFTWLQITLAGVSMYIFARVLRLRRPAALLAAIVYMFSGFFIVSVVFSMIIAAAAWLPLLLACIEVIVRKQAEKGDVLYSPVPYLAAGALVLGVQTLAGHIEITYYTLLVASFYAAWRLVQLWRRLRTPRPALRLAAWLLVMVALGLLLGAVQLMPLYELVRGSFRQGSVGYSEVVGWAWPLRQILTFFVPDIFGNPSHHAYRDLWSGTWQTAVNAAGEPVRAIFWGVKNYVEGGNYVGILTLLLAVVGVASWFLGHRAGERGSGGAGEQRSTDGGQPAGLFAALAVLSLLFAFGTPFYALLFYGLPGYKQLHSAFRWVFPYTLSVAVLAGCGLQLLGSRFQVSGSRLTEWRATAFVSRHSPFALAWLALLGGGGVLALLAVSRFFPAPFIALGQFVVEHSDLAQAVFADGRAFWSYQVPNLLKFGVMATLAGAWLLWSTRPHVLRFTFHVSRSTLFASAAVALVLLDLWLFGYGFNPAAEPRLLEFTPPVVDFLRQDQSLWRFTTFIAPGEKTFNANVGMFYGFHDVRGYDSIIPQQYVAFMERIEAQDELLFNRIAPLSEVASLDSPLLDLLGVRYVLTTQYVPNPGYTLVYDQEVKVYRNEDAFPRAFVMHCQGEEKVRGWPEGFDPRTMLLLDTGYQALDTDDGRSGGGEARLLTSCSRQPATISSYGLNEVFVETELERDGWLVLADSFAPGWKAYDRGSRFQVPGSRADTGEPETRNLEPETPVALYRADGNFRAVYLQAGRHTVHFKYMPRSFQMGLYTSFLAGVALFLLCGWWAWGRFYREAEGEEHTVRRVAKNTLIPMGMSLLNKGVDFVFAMLRLRVLSPGGEGSYTFAIAFYTFFEIIVRFGLGTLLTREVAKVRSEANRFFSNVVALRLKLWLASLPVILLLGWGYRRWGGLTGEEAAAIALFAVALLFASFADAVNATFNAYEKMEFPAGLTSAIALSKVALGALVLLPPLEWGFVGLAGVALLMNAVQAAWLYLLLRQKLFTPRVETDRRLQREMLGLSFPLMINHLLATIFWRIDIWILKPLAGAAAVGIYSAGLKYLDGLNVIPAYFTLAIFPLMSRLAHDSQESLLRAYRLALRLLLLVALPVVVFVLFTAEPLIEILGGAEYLPGSAIALRLLILSIPFGFINSVTQYVLIAVNQQRFLTRAFLIGVLFNSVANLIFIPRYGYRAAALILIPSELSLLIPFYWCVRRHLAPIPWLDIFWRPLAAAVAMAAVIWVSRSVSLPLALLLGFLVGGVVLVLLGTFRHPDFDVLRQRLKWERLRARLAGLYRGA
ncbi:MAG: oligosaccharide flippase family protein [Anaerolineae bacterium]|nr:oligosaccharide flippase family protein [Anaerolineae bacterium]